MVKLTLQLKAETFFVRVLLLVGDINGIFSIIVGSTAIC